MTHTHYESVRKLMAKANRLYEVRPSWDPDARSLPPDRTAPTAVLMVGGQRGAGMHTLNWVLKTFPGRFSNFVFIAVGEVDKDSFASARHLKSLTALIENSLQYFVSYCVSLKLRAAAYSAYGADPLDELGKLTEKVLAEYPDAVCFAGKLVFERDTVFTRFLHNQMPLAMQERLEKQGRDMVIVPLQVATT